MKSGALEVWGTKRLTRREWMQLSRGSSAAVTQELLLRHGTRNPRKADQDEQSEETKIKTEQHE